jgi:hypothetical protein
MAPQQQEGADFTAMPTGLPRDVGVAQQADASADVASFASLNTGMLSRV